MLTSGFTESQLINSLKEAKAGLPFEPVLSKYGVIKAFFSQWENNDSGIYNIMLRCLGDKRWRVVASS